VERPRRPSARREGRKGKRRRKSCTPLYRRRFVAHRCEIEKGKRWGGDAFERSLFLPREPASGREKKRKKKGGRRKLDSCPLSYCASGSLPILATSSRWQEGERKKGKGKKELSAVYHHSLEGSCVAYPLSGHDEGRGEKGGGTSSSTPLYSFSAGRDIRCPRAMESISLKRGK